MSLLSWIYLKIGLLSGFTHINVEGDYHSHQQACAFVYVVDRKFDLSIKPDGTFIYSVKTHDSRRAPMGATTTKVLGIWELQGDTLTLFVNDNKEGAVFVIRNGNIISAEQKYNIENRLLFCFGSLKKVTDKELVTDKDLEYFQP